jgi:hypothetical protein
MASPYLAAMAWLALTIPSRGVSCGSSAPSFRSSAAANSVAKLPTRASWAKWASPEPSECHIETPYARTIRRRHLECNIIWIRFGVEVQTDLDSVVNGENILGQVRNLSWSCQSDRVGEGDLGDSHIRRADRRRQQLPRRRRRRRRDCRRPWKRRPRCPGLL